ncbi:hypothetical protein DSO57_1024087 [Entomophthora muscae]|uniref:Uncharacterized protein n=1 Tax=Entomophthora muscae TaxID=34485 RepID=A0ACC2TQ39_9FUNG|nr:hypothetical protein DSO57_1024087 [Entomophthora muscae]
MPHKCLLKQGVAHLVGSGLDVEFMFTQRRHGIQVDIKVNSDVQKLSEKGFPYHIHEAPVSTDCASTKKHLDSFNRNPNGSDPAYKCNPNAPELCEQGDLSGKHSVLKGDVNTYTYMEYNLPHLKNLYGTTSVVIHLPNANKTRLACATIQDKHPK